MTLLSKSLIICDRITDLLGICCLRCLGESVSSEFQTKFGVSYILELENLETGEVIKSFSTSRLPNRKFQDGRQNHYIQSLGLKPKKGGDEHFYDFVYIPEPIGV